MMDFTILVIALLRCAGRLDGYGGYLRVDYLQTLRNRFVANCMICGIFDDEGGT